MKTGMKKAVACYLAATMGATMLTGCSSIEMIKDTLIPPTPEKILSDCTENLLNAKTTEAEWDMNFDMVLGNGETEVTIDYDVSMDIEGRKKDKDGYEGYMDGELEVSTLGSVSQSSKIESYVIGEGDKTTTYSKSGDAEEWSKKEEDSEARGVMVMDFSSLSDLELLEETETKDEKECYVFKGTVEDGDFVDGLYEEMEVGELGIEDMKVNVVLYVDKKEKLPVSMEVSIDDEIFEEALEGEQAEELSMGIKDFTMEINYTKINGEVDFEIPEEVFEAKEAEEESESGLFDGFTGDIDEEAPEEEVDDTEEFIEEEIVGLNDEWDLDIGEESEEEYSDSDEAVIDYEQLKKEGIECEEYVVDENAVYIKATNSNSMGKYLTVKGKLKKDGKVVGEQETSIEIEPNAYGVSVLYSEDAFDSIEYTYEVEDIDYKEQAGKYVKVTCEIDEEEGVITGKATNTSDKAIEFVQINVVFYDKDKNIIGQSMGFPEADEMKPSETSDYDMYYFCEDFDSYEVYTIANVVD